MFSANSDQPRVPRRPWLVGSKIREKNKKNATRWDCPPGRLRITFQLFLGSFLPVQSSHKGTPVQYSVGSTGSGEHPLHLTSSPYISPLLLSFSDCGFVGVYKMVIRYHKTLRPSSLNDGIGQGLQDYPVLSIYSSPDSLGEVSKFNVRILPNRPFHARGRGQADLNRHPMQCRSRLPRMGSRGVEPPTARSHFKCRSFMYVL